MRHALALLVLVAVSSPALDGLAQIDDDEARAHFDMGVELYEQGRFDQAAVAFGRAYELKPSFRILFNIGQVENELGHYAAALTAYRSYLEEGGAAVPVERAERVRADIERLDTLVGMIAVEGAPAGTLILVDKEELGRTPLAEELLVDLGRHEVVLEKDGEQLLQRVIKVAGGEIVVLELEAEASSPKADGDHEEETDPDGEEGGRMWTWVAFGVGGASLIGAVVTGSLALSKESDLRDRCNGGVCPDEVGGDFDTVENLALTTDILIGVAAAGIVAGTVLFFVEPGLGAESDVVVAPTATLGGAGLTLSGRF